MLKRRCVLDAMAAAVFVFPLSLQAQPTADVAVQPDTTTDPATAAVEPSDARPLRSIPVDPAGETKESPETRAGAKRENALIEEIVVTSQKREELIQDVPLSVQAFSAEKLDVLGVTNAVDLPRVSSGLVITETLGFVTTFLRGLGTDAFVFADPSVAFYVDGIYNPAPTTASKDFGVVERIEVLKGPQGTLFGRNAVGGAINIITAAPSFEQPEASVNVSYEDYGATRTRASVSIPLDDTFAFGVSGFYNNGENYIDGRVDGKPLPRNVEKGGRIKLRWMPSDFLELNLAASTVSSTGLKSSYAVNTHPSLLARALLIQPQDPYAGSLNEAPDVRFDESIYSGQVTVFTDWFDIKLLGGIQDSESVSGLDFDGSPLPVVYLAVNPNIQQLKSAELQVVSKDTSWASDDFKWIVGGYYFQGHAGYKDGDGRIAGTQLDAAARVAGIALPQGLRNILDTLDGLPVPTGMIGFSGLLDTHSVSGYAQATYDFNDVVSLTLGGRYQVEKRDIDESQAYARTQNGARILIPGQNFSCDTDAQWCSVSKDFSPKVGIDFHLNEDSLLYLSWQTASKSGTFNTVNLYDKPEYVKPEKISAYELGIKTSAFDGLVKANAALFYYDLDELQTQFVSLLAGGAITFENASAARVYGGDFDVIAQLVPELVDDLVLTLSGSFLPEAKYTDFQNGSGFNQTTGVFQQGNDFTGNRIVRSPKFSGTVGLFKTFSVPIGAVEVGADYYSNSGFYYLAQNQPNDYENRYGLLGARATLVVDAWNFRLTAFGTNLLGTEYNVSRFTEDFGTLDARAPKAVYGIRLGWML